MSERDAALRPDGGPVAREGGAPQAFEQERASATPTAPRPDTSPEDRPRDAAEPPPGIVGPLEPLLRWFSDVTTTPGSVQAGIERARETQAELQAPSIESIVRPNARMSAAGRMGVYHYAYHARLTDCVMDDFEGVERALGKPTFERLCRRYVESHPSTGPDLNVYAQHFPAFLAAQDDLPHPAGFLSDLARLEWGMIEVIHAPPAAPLDLGALSEAPPETWAGVRLFGSPTLRVLRFDYPVNAWFQRSLDEPDHPVPEARPTVTAIYREDWRVWRMDCTPRAAAVLHALLAGAPLGEALAALADEAETDHTDVQKWFQEWVSSGFFARLELPRQTT